ncbi:glycosyltransferase family 15 protein [Favolaschia claudopus]|uniref:Glycosyltransferase family 15 protein n=1 Tax=Favolaschia claudopus TaxID=2862362 RepID=A0AAW0E2H5_9AGAR
MPRRRRLYILIAIIIAFAVYYLNGSVHTSEREGLSRSSSWQEPPYKTPIPEKYYGTANSTQRASAVIVILARNRELREVLASMARFERRFNRNYGYPYVFLNEVLFTDEFKEQVSTATSAQVQFGLIPHEHWFQPSWIDESKASAARQAMGPLFYGHSVSYRNMCRFQSGFFFRHPLLQQYKYYWRVEPDVQFYCDIEFDPFLFMEGEDKKYAFTVALPENEKTIKGLWPAVLEFKETYPHLISPDNAFSMLVDRQRDTYNGCHFWSNFEIASFDLWRSDAYLKFFDFMDSKGGFYYSRWGDAILHTFGAALFLRKDQIHFFNEIGYRHVPITHCPSGPSHSRGRCECNVTDSFDRHSWSCLDKYDGLFIPDGSSP